MCDWEGGEEERGERRGDGEGEGKSMKCGNRLPG